jgi:hypothetical protein
MTKTEKLLVLVRIATRNHYEERSTENFDAVRYAVACASDWGCTDAEIDRAQTQGRKQAIDNLALQAKANQLCPYHFGDGGTMADCTC